MDSVYVGRPDCLSSALMSISRLFIPDEDVYCRNVESFFFSSSFGERFINLCAVQKGTLFLLIIAHMRLHVLGLHYVTDIPYESFVDVCIICLKT